MKRYKVVIRTSFNSFVYSLFYDNTYKRAVELAAELNAFFASVGLQCGAFAEEDEQA